MASDILQMWAIDKEPEQHQRDIVTKHTVTHGGFGTFGRPVFLSGADLNQDTRERKYVNLIICLIICDSAEPGDDVIVT